MRELELRFAFFSFFPRQCMNERTELGFESKKWFDEVSFIMKTEIIWGKDFSCGQITAEDGH